MRSRLEGYPSDVEFANHQSGSVPAAERVQARSAPSLKGSVGVECCPSIRQSRRHSLTFAPPDSDKKIEVSGRRSGGRQHVCPLC